MHPPSEFDPVRCKDGKDDADGRNGHGNGHAGGGEDIGEDIGCTGVEVEDGRSGRVKVAVDLGSLAATCTRLFRLTPLLKFHAKVLLTA